MQYISSRLTFFIMWSSPSSPLQVMSFMWSVSFTVSYHVLYHFISQSHLSGFSVMFWSHCKSALLYHQWIIKISTLFNVPQSIIRSYDINNWYFLSQVIWSGKLLTVFCTHCKYQCTSERWGQAPSAGMAGTSSHCYSASATPDWSAARSTPVLWPRSWGQAELTFPLYLEKRGAERRVTHLLFCNHKFCRCSPYS